MRRNGTLIAAMLVREGDADGMLCGTFGTYASHLQLYRRGDRPARAASGSFAAMNLLMLPRQTVFICDTYVNCDPTRRAARRDGPARGGGGAALRADAAGRAAVAFELRQRRHAARRARCATRCDLIREQAPELEVDGEMHGDAALCRAHARPACCPTRTLTGEANLLVMPNLDAANITFNALKIVAGRGRHGRTDPARRREPVHILTPTSTVRRLVNMTALTAVDAAAVR